jgi:hypothetical protein
MARPYAARRPAGVTFVVVVTWLVAFASMVRGFLALFGVDAVFEGTDLTGSDVTVSGWVEIILGVVTAMVAIGLAGGSSLARLLVTALMVLRIVAAVWTAITFSGLGGILASALIGGLATLVLLLLWNYRADQFFHQY